MKGYIAQRIAGEIGNILASLFFTFRAEGREYARNLKPPCLIISNHRSYLDHFFILAAIPRRSALFPVRVMAKDSLYRSNVLRFFFWLLGAFPARRHEGIESALKTPMKLLTEGFAVGMYPEGKIVEGALFGEPRRGAALLALRTGITVLPIALIGFKQGLGIRNFFKRHMVVVRFGKPFRLTQAIGLQANSRLLNEDPLVWRGTALLMDHIKNLYFEQLKKPHFTVDLSERAFRD